MVGGKKNIFYVNLILTQGYYENWSDRREEAKLLTAEPLKVFIGLEWTSDYCFYVSDVSCLETLG